MISDEERREVARRLQEAIGLHEFAEVLGFDWTDDSDWGWEDVSNLVADLIEPSERACYYYDAETNHCRCYDTRLVDREALLALADEMDRDGKMQWERQKAGEHWFIDGLDVREYARRIREALGVQDA